MPRGKCAIIVIGMLGGDGVLEGTVLSNAGSS